MILMCLSRKYKQNKDHCLRGEWRVIESMFILKYLNYQDYKTIKKEKRRNVKCFDFCHLSL